MNTTRYLCLLRGINVAGHRKVKMAELRKVFEDLGGSGVESYLQSGNVVFEFSPKTLKPSVISNALKEATGHDITVFLYTKNEFQKVVRANPFKDGSQYDSQWLHLTFLAKPKASCPFESHITQENGDEARFAAGHYFIYCPNGYGRTKLNNQFLERKTDLPATTRNWKTVSTLLQMLGDPMA